MLQNYEKIQHYQNTTITPRGYCASIIKNRYCIIMTGVNKLEIFFILKLNSTKTQLDFTLKLLSNARCYLNKKGMYSLVKRFHTK